MNEKIPFLLSSPSRKRYKDTIQGITTILYQGELAATNLQVMYNKVDTAYATKATSKKSLQTGGELSSYQARCKLIAKRK
jgi:hypothetical protein